MVRVALRIMRFYAHESCGWCIPCREGTTWLQENSAAVRRRPRPPRRCRAAGRACRRTCWAARSARWATPRRMPTISIVDKFAEDFEKYLARRRWCWYNTWLKSVKLTINGRAIEAEKGTLLIEAARQNGIEIPSFCYYEGLTLQAACRMCLVEVEKTPKLQVGCTLPVAEGMVVHTESDVVKEARKGTLEFLLTNHPLDCPVCDKGGECELQDMVFRYGAGESRFTERKVHVDEKQWSPVVYFDAPRCILCYRCVRVCNEGMGVNALGVSQSRRDLRDRSQSSRSSGMRRVRRLHRHLPGGRAHQRHLSLSDAALGDEARRHHLHALRRRLPHHAGRAQRQNHPRQQSRPQRHQRRVPVRQGPLRVRFHRASRSACNRR